MHSNYPPRETIRERLDVVFSDDDLVLEDYGAGHAWLRSEPLDPDAPIPYVLTDRGRRVIGSPRAATCPACGRGQDTPDCAQREHWGVPS